MNKKTEEARAELSKVRAGQILTQKDLCSAVITVVMSDKQAHRNEAAIKLQRHILRVEEERDQREAECERWAKVNSDLARKIATATSTIGHHAIVDSEGFTIASPSPMGQANARLIAAAPELLSALRDLVALARDPDYCDFDAETLIQRVTA